MITDAEGGTKTPMPSQPNLHLPALSNGLGLEFSRYGLEASCDEYSDSFEQLRRAIFSSGR